jgi:hypothetical protein
MKRTSLRHRAKDASRGIGCDLCCICRLNMPKPSRLINRHAAVWTRYCLFSEILEVTYASRAKYPFVDIDEAFPGYRMPRIANTRQFFS